MIETRYEPESWTCTAGRFGDEQASRCAECYRLRMGLTVETARREGFEAVATTLTVSPYQDPEAIGFAGREAAASAGVEYLETDFRDRYRRAVERSKELGMYRQRYCGCLLSQVEAERSRTSKRRR